MNRKQSLKYMNIMKSLIADIPLGSGPLKGVGPLGTSGPTADIQFESTLSKIIGVMTAVAFIWFTFMIVIGAIRILTSGGDKGAVEAARKQITTAVIGIVVVIAAVFIVSLIGTLFGINSILHPTCVIFGTC